MPEDEVTRSALAELAAEYAAELPGLIDELARLVDAAAADPAAVPHARAAAHRLRGTAGSYGFKAVGEAAGSIEDALEAGAADVSGLVCVLAALVRPPS